MNETDRVKKFIQLYNQLDAFLRTQLPQSAHIDHSLLLQESARKLPVAQRHLFELRSFAQLRNILVHDMYRHEDEVIAIPTKEVINRFADIVKAIINPPTAYSLAVPAGILYTATMADNALKVMRDMNKMTFTHVPVLKDGLMVGIFSENTIFSYLIHEKESIIDASMKISDFDGFIGFDQHPGEKFAFLPRNASLNDLQLVFSTAMKTHTRIGMVFLTASGKPTEKLLGIVTAWDLAKSV